MVALPPVISVDFACVASIVSSTVGGPHRVGSCEQNEVTATARRDQILAGARLDGVASPAERQDRIIAVAGRDQPIADRGEE